MEALEARAGELRDALEELSLEYQDWRESIPENLESSPTAEKLDETIDSLEQATACAEECSQFLESIEPPLGFGRD